MGFLRRLFGTNGASSVGNTGDPNGIYFYVRPTGCEEVVRVRIDRNNDLSQDDDGQGLFVRKYVRGSKCHQTAELYVTFDANRRIATSDVQHGAIVSEDDYHEWMKHNESQVGRS